MTAQDDIQLVPVIPVPTLALKRKSPCVHLELRASPLPFSLEKLQEQQSRWPKLMFTEVTSNGV